MPNGKMKKYERFCSILISSIIGGDKKLYIAPTLCFMLLDGAAIFKVTTYRNIYLVSGEILPSDMRSFGSGPEIIILDQLIAFFVLSYFRLDYCKEY